MRSLSGLSALVLAFALALCLPNVVHALVCGTTTCPALTCKDAGCDFRNPSNCAYANKRCNTCDGYTGAKADFIFNIDDSGSMAPKINAVRDGLNNFVATINAKGIDARYAIISNGFQSQDFLGAEYTNNPTFINTQLTTIANRASGGWEANLNVMLIAAQQAVNNSLLAMPGATFSPTALQFRPDATLKVIIQLTDEDSDRPYMQVNRFPGQPMDSLFSEPDCGSGSLITGDQNEVDATAARLVAANVKLYMLQNQAQGCSMLQFGNMAMQQQWTDFTHFDRVRTLANYVAAGTHLGSLQYKVLNAGGMARLYDVTQIADPNFVNNFYSSIFDNPTLCNPCVSGTCVADACVLTPACNDGDGCTTDSCTNVGGVAQCSFPQVACTPPNACTISTCNPLSGTCDGVLDQPVVCPVAGQIVDPCISKTCFVNASLPGGYGCADVPKVCPADSDVCTDAVCVSGQGCFQRTKATVECCTCAQIPCRVCDPPCGGNNVTCCDGVCNCPPGTTDGGIYFDNYGGRCVPPCPLECGDKGTCKFLDTPTGPTSANRGSYCACAPGYVYDNTTGTCVLAPIPPGQAAPPIVSKTTAVVGGVVLGIALLALLILGGVIWKIRMLQTELVELDAFQDANVLGDNPLYKEAGGWKENSTFEVAGLEAGRM